MLKRDAFLMPICQSVSSMMTAAQWERDDGAFSDVMERHFAAEERDGETMFIMDELIRSGLTPVQVLSEMFPDDFTDDDADDDLPDPETMDWECPYWDDPDVDDDLLIAARLHREARLSRGLED